MSTCERCNNETMMTIMSIFNTQNICTECKDKEQKHPKYKLAWDTERSHILKGNYNFPGIGLPKDLSS